VRNDHTYSSARAYEEPQTPAREPTIGAATSRYAGVVFLFCARLEKQQRAKSTISNTAIERSATNRPDSRAMSSVIFQRSNTNNNHSLQQQQQQHSKCSGRTKQQQQQQSAYCSSCCSGTDSQPQQDSSSSSSCNDIEAGNSNTNNIRQRADSASSLEALAVPFSASSVSSSSSCYETNSTNSSSCHSSLSSLSFSEILHSNLLLHNNNKNATKQQQQQHAHSGLHFRAIRPSDRQQIQELHEAWFPVQYQDEFYDSLVEGRMFGTDEALYTYLAVEDDNNSDDSDSNNTIVACVVGSFVSAHSLSAATRTLLVQSPARHPRLFYIMTLGCRPAYRHQGLGTYLIQQCLQQCAQRDAGCGAVYLHVWVHNQAAVRMYERLDFYRVQEIPGYYRIRNEPHACYLYAQYLHGNAGHRGNWWQRIERVVWRVWNRVVVRAAATVVEHTSWWRHYYRRAALLENINSNNNNSSTHGRAVAVASFTEGQSGEGATTAAANKDVDNNHRWDR